jgi:hypothetical protein
MSEEKERAATFIPNLYRGLLEKTGAIRDVSMYMERVKDDTCEEECNGKQQPNTTIICIQDIQNQIKNFVKKTGDTISGNLYILKQPEEGAEVANKEYVDGVFSNMSAELKVLESKLYKGVSSNLDLKLFNIKNLNYPTDVHDAANKSYVDKKFDILNKSRSIQDIFSKGQIVHSIKKTFFFNPGFICPRKIHIVSVGLSTSPYKYKIGEKLKLGEVNPIKLYFMINNEIKSEYPIEKDIQLGYILKEFNDPIVFEKGDNLMMIMETILEDVSVNVSFY